MLHVQRGTITERFVFLYRAYRTWPDDDDDGSGCIIVLRAFLCINLSQPIRT